jgi:hypothetical protein
MDYKYVVLALFLVPMATASPGIFDEPKGDALDAAMEHVQCRAEFTIAVMESQMEHLGGNGLHDDIDAIEDDLEELQDLADNGDIHGFRSYLWVVFADNMLDARQNAMEHRNQANMTHQVRLKLRSDYFDAKDDFDSCNAGALSHYADAKLDGYNVLLEAAEERAENLSEKGLDTSGLEELIDDAQEQVVGPLEDELDGAESAVEIREALGSYCMFNGCRDGFNFHMAAKWNIEKLDQILVLIEEDAESAGLGDDWDDASGYISDADDALSAVGDDQYEGTEHSDVWDNIRSASETLKDVISELRSG